MSSSVSTLLDSSGRFVVRLYPSQSLSPRAYYQLWFEEAGTGRREFLGLYDIPASDMTISLAGHQVTDSNLVARYVFASVGQVEALVQAVAGLDLAALLGGAHTPGALQMWSDAGGFVDSPVRDDGATISFIDRALALSQLNGNLSVAGNVSAQKFIGDFEGVSVTGGAGIGLNVRDYGALGNNVADDSAAFQSAMNAVAAGVSTGLYIPPGVYKISNAVVKAFNNSVSSVVIYGAGSRSVIHVAGGGSKYCFDLRAIQSITFRDLAFVGTAGVADDTAAAVRLFDIRQANIVNCHFFGLISQSGAVVRADQSFLTIDRSGFWGCSGNSANGTGVVTVQSFEGLRVTRTTFLDYGVLNGTDLLGAGLGKTGLGTAAHWIRVGNPRFDSDNALAQNTPIFEDCVFDEGAFSAVNILTFTDPGFLPNYVTVRRCAFNVNSGGNGVYLARLRGATVEDCFFGYTSVGDANAIVCAGAGQTIIRNVRMRQRAKGIIVLLDISAPFGTVLHLENVASDEGQYVYAATTAVGVFIMNGAGGASSYHVVASGAVATIASLLPTTLLDTDAPVRMGDCGARPAADVAHRGKIWVTRGGAGEADTYAICMKKADDTYAWADIATP